MAHLATSRQGEPFLRLDHRQKNNNYPDALLADITDPQKQPAYPVREIQCAKPASETLEALLSPRVCNSVLAAILKLGVFVTELPANKAYTMVENTRQYKEGLGKQPQSTVTYVTQKVKVLHPP